MVYRPRFRYETVSVGVDVFASEAIPVDAGVKLLFVAEPAEVCVGELVSEGVGVGATVCVFDDDLAAVGLGIIASERLDEGVKVAALVDDPVDVRVGMLVEV